MPFKRPSRRVPLVAAVVTGALLLSGCMGNTKSTEVLIAESSGGVAPIVAGGGAASGVTEPAAVAGADANGAPAPGAAGSAAVPTTTTGVTGAAPKPGTTGSAAVPVAPGKKKSTGAAASQGTSTTAGGAKAGPASGSAALGTKPAACTGRKSTIVIGGVGQLTGVLGTLFSGGAKAMQAWATMINATGGLACHPVKYISADDGGDPSRHLALIRRLVEQDKVIAMVYQSGLITGQASRDYIIEKKIPTIGQEGGEMHFIDSPIFFSSSSAGKALVDWTIVAGARAALGEGKNVLGTLTCQEVVFCAVADTSWKERGAKLGFKPVYAGKASLLNVDFTSQCLAAKQAGVTALGMAFDTSGIERIAQSCAAVNFKPLYFYTSVQSNLSFTSNPNLVNSSIAQPLLPWFLTDRPEIQQFQAVMKKYAPGLAIDSSSINGWAAATLFERAADAFEEDTVTSAGILKAMWQVKNDNLDGLSYPLTFNETKPQEQKVCGWVVRVRPGKFESDGKMTCG